MTERKPLTLHLGTTTRGEFVLAEIEGTGWCVSATGATEYEAMRELIQAMAKALERRNT